LGRPARGSPRSPDPKEMPTRAFSSPDSRYEGTWFKSKLEARWAVFFDSFNMKWKYESRGFFLKKSNLYYLPDFYLPDLDVWWEVKPDEPGEVEQEKCSDLCEQTKSRVFVAFGDIPFPHPGDGISAYCWMYHLCNEQIKGAGTIGWDSSYWWCLCNSCLKAGIEYEGRAARICRHDEDDKGYNYDSYILLTAYRNARIAFRD